jgi:hypothetical protein
MNRDRDGVGLLARRVNGKAMLLITAILPALLFAPWFASISSAEQQQTVTVCERQWYCLWLCKKCRSETR